MEMTKILARRDALRQRAEGWQRAALGLLALSAAANTALWGAFWRADKLHREESARLVQQVRQAERVRDHALEKLGALSQEVTRERQAREEQAAAYEAAGDYQYIGQCTITAYCPCGECCGKWADGLTATGLPAGPGIVAVDESVIPLGSTVVIDGQEYLAADTGVTGNHVDICMADHQETVEHGVRTAAVWIARGPVEGDRT